MTATEGTALPANARIETVQFDDGSNALRVGLRGVADERSVSADAIAALFGGRIRHESTTVVTGGGGISFGKLAVTAATGIPVGITKSGPKTKATVGEELHTVLALRTDGISEIWYLVATSFNFRKALGAQATYSGEANMRAFVKRLAAFAPHAVQDGFFTALLLGSALPPPLESLLEFFRYAAAT